MRTLRRLAWGLLLIPLGASGVAEAQLGTAQPAISRQPQLSFGLGPFRIAPYIRIGEIALDTNVFYTQEDRRTDLLTGGGPGLRITLPIRRVSLYADGNANYYWFARTVSERKFGGQAGGGIDASLGVVRLGASRSYTRTYDRPSIEVDRRVLRDEWRNRFYLSIAEDAGVRFRISPSVTTERMDVDSGTSYLGSDLGRALSQDQITAALEAKYRLTAKTDLIILGDQEWSRYPKDHTRDADSNRLAGGFAVSSETRLSGRFVGGIRLIRPKATGRGRSFMQPYGDGALEWRFGPKTLLAADYRLDTYQSVFDTSNERLPTMRMQTVGLRLNRRLVRRIDLDLRGGLTTLKNNAPVVIKTSEGDETLVRDDKAYLGSFDLGWRIFDRLRLGAVATYRERFSNFHDFGVDGLLLGASLRFNP